MNEATGMTYCRDIAEIHDAVIHLLQEGRRRIRLAEQLGDDVLGKEPWRVGPRLVILLEEVNAIMAQLKRYWERIRWSGDPKVSPAVDALVEILGRHGLPLGSWGVENSMIFEARARAGAGTGDAQRAPARAAWPPSTNSAVGRSDNAWIRT
ncbi:hypothetical protein [Streptomyces sp. NPDC054783]